MTFEESNPARSVPGAEPAVPVVTSTLAPVGTRFGHFRVLSHLGSGAGGEVYRVLDEKLRVERALKVHKPDAGDPDRHARFLKEARALARVEHPNIVRIVQVGGDDPPYYVMDLVEGGTLRARMQNGPMPVPDAIDAMIQTLAALENMHEKRIVHRDVKPSNLLVAKDGTVKVSDFGIVRTHASDDTLTRTNVSLGTPGYMAPEQWDGQGNVGPTADVYGAGATLLALVTGMETRRDLGLDGLRQEVLAQAPPEVRGVIERATANGRESRYQTAAEMSAALSRVKRWPRLGGMLERWAAHGRYAAMRRVLATAVAPNGRGRRAYGAALVLLVAFAGGLAAAWSASGPWGASTPVAPIQLPVSTPAPVSAPAPVSTPTPAGASEPMVGTPAPPVAPDVALVAEPAAVPAPKGGVPAPKPSTRAPVTNAPVTPAPVTPAPATPDALRTSTSVGAAVGGLQLRVNAQPDKSEVFVNQTRAGLTPFLASYPAGAYTILVRERGGAARERTFSVDARGGRVRATICWNHDDGAACDGAPDALVLVPLAQAEGDAP